MHFLEIVVCDCSTFCLCGHGVAFILWRLCFLIFPIQAWSFTAQVCVRAAFTTKESFGRSLNMPCKQYSRHLFSIGPPGVSDTTSMKNRALTVTAVRTLQCGHTVWGTGQALKQELGTPPKDPCRSVADLHSHVLTVPTPDLRASACIRAEQAAARFVEQLPSGPPCCHYLVLEKRGVFSIMSLAFEF